MLSIDAWERRVTVKNGMIGAFSGMPETPAET
jgi:hypothetical protein